jgi:hypothetical protein
VILVALADVVTHVVVLALILVDADVVLGVEDIAKGHVLPNVVMAAQAVKVHVISYALMIAIKIVKISVI